MTDQHAPTDPRDGVPPARSASAGPRQSCHLCLLLLAGVLAACASPGPFVRVEDLPIGNAAGLDEEYRIAPGDVLSVRIWNQEAMSLARALVRADGKISVPFLQDVEATNRTPNELASVLKARLQAYVVAPVVTVILEELHPLRIPVMGEVTRPGIYDIDRKGGVLVALAAAGGFTEFARRDRIHVLRYQLPIGEPVPMRIRFDYRALSAGERAAGGFRLRDGDVVVVD